MNVVDSQLKTSGAAMRSVDELSMAPQENKVIPPEEHIGLEATALDNDILTGRQTEIMAAFATGRIHAAVAALLFIAQGTLKTHLKNIYQKLGVNNSHAAVAMVIAEGLVKVSKVPKLDTKQSKVKNLVLVFLTVFNICFFVSSPQDGANDITNPITSTGEVLRPKPRNQMRNRGRGRRREGENVGGETIG